MSTVIELKNIKKSFRTGESSIEILHGIDLTIEHGELVAIMGASGSGKSTLMNIIGLLDTQSEGEYLLDNTLTSNLDDDARSELRNRTIGFVFQQFFLLPRLTAKQNVALPLKYRTDPVKNVDELCLEMLKKVSMDHRANNKPYALSGGQQQRVAIARALAGSPRILLADEPTGALDSKTTEEVMDLFIDLNESQGVTTIIVTHDLDIAQQCHRIIQIKDGNIQH